MHYARWYRGADVGPAKLLRTPGDPDATEKACTICGEVKPLGDFYIDKRNATGRMSSCRACFNKRDAEAKVLRKYGLTAKQRGALADAQEHRCAICREDRVLVVDHCHRSGKVRALLCDRCNRLLGVADDQIELLEAAIRFLEAHRPGGPA